MGATAVVVARRAAGRVAVVAVCNTLPVRFARLEAVVAAIAIEVALLAAVCAAMALFLARVVTRRTAGCVSVIAAIAVGVAGRIAGCGSMVKLVTVQVPRYAALRVEVIGAAFMPRYGAGSAAVVPAIAVKVIVMIAGSEIMVDLVAIQMPRNAAGGVEVVGTVLVALHAASSARMVATVAGEVARCIAGRKGMFLAIAV